MKPSHYDFSDATQKDTPENKERIKNEAQNGQFSVRFCVKRNLFGSRVENHVYANKPRKKGISQILKSFSWSFFTY